MILNKCRREELPIFYRWEVKGLEGEVSCQRMQVLPLCV